MEPRMNTDRHRSSRENKAWIRRTLIFGLVFVVPWVLLWLPAKWAWVVLVLGGVVLGSYYVIRHQEQKQFDIEA